MIKLEITLDDLDYDMLIDRFLPVLTEKLRESGNPIGMLLSNGMPSAMAKKILAGLPQEKKDALAAELLNAYQNQIMDLAENAAHQQGLSLRVVSAQASVS